MPQTVHKRDLTIALYRLVAMDNGETKSMPDQSWGEALLKAKLGDLELESGATATLQSVGNKRRLVCSRDRGYSPRQRNRISGRKSSVPISGADWQVIEESFISFLDYGNVFAFARSGISAPQPPVVAEWLEQANVLSDQQWIVLPLIDEGRFRLLQNHRRATWLHVKGYPSPAVEVPDSAPLVKHFLKSDGVPGIEMELRLQAKERSLASTVPNAIAQETLGVMAVLGQVAPATVETIGPAGGKPAQAAAAPSQSIDARGRGTVGPTITSASVKVEGENDPINLIEHHLTFKTQAAIALKPKDRSLKEKDVFAVMDRETESHKRAIFKALGR